MKMLTFLFLMISTVCAFSQGLVPDTYDGIQRTNKERIFLDNFDDNRYFWIKESSPSTHRIADGFLYFSNEYDFPFLDGKAIAFDGKRDFEIEARIKFVSGDVEASNGLMWGQLVFGQKFIYSFTSLGKIKIEIEDGFEAKTIFETTNLEIVNQTDDNDLVVRKYKDKYFFFFNNTLIHTTEAGPLPGQHIGFKVAPNSLVRINFLRLWYIKE